jgi:hypothetical protein
MPCWKQPRGTPSYCPSSSRSEPRRCPCDGRAPAAHGRVRPAHLMTSAAAGSGGRSARPWALQRTGVRVHVHAHSNWAAQGCGARGRIARRAIKRDSGTETCQARRRHGGGASASGAARLATNSPLPSARARAPVRLGRSFFYHRHLHVARTSYTPHDIPTPCTPCSRCSSSRWAGPTSSSSPPPSSTCVPQYGPPYVFSRPHR